MSRETSTPPARTPVRVQGLTALPTTISRTLAFALRDEVKKG